MAEEVITWSSPGGAETHATAEVVRYGPTSRLLSSVSFVVVGLVGGTACLIIPIVHLITTWALPLIGIVLGMRAYRTEAKIFALTGPCPACGEPIQIAGGAAHELDATCPKCAEALTVRLAGADGAPGRPAGPDKP